ncbi:MAG: DUF4097 family beta strand repeat protein [Candidatus Aminicenantes bacterium]|nr:DUF4097 family beta strand repeat protein [Candidatus Aminicenantes bacterium]
MKKIVLFAILIFIAALTSFYAAENRESLNLAAAGLQSLDIDCGAGYLKVQGVDGLEQIEVSALLVVRGIADSELAEFKKEFVTVTLKKDMDRAVLIAKIKSNFSLPKLFSGVSEARIDLDIRVPLRLSLEIDDGSGDVDIRDCDGNVKLEDGSGDMHLTHIRGHVDIEDGSGDIELNDAGNDVDIDDGSGQISLHHIRGSVEVDDGSGDIVIDGAEKDVTIDEAGSGNVDITNVKGRVRK